MLILRPAQAYLCSREPQMDTDEHRFSGPGCRLVSLRLRSLSDERIPGLGKCGFEPISSVFICVHLWLYCIVTGQAFRFRSQNQAMPAVISTALAGSGMNIMLSTTVGVWGVVAVFMILSSAGMPANGAMFPS